MPLSPDRIITPGQTPHAHERDAFDFVVRELPDTDPYRLWAFVDLIDDSGRRYDIDLLILGYHALYLVEVKSHVGTLVGDEVDWTVTFPDGGRTTFENPLRATNLKARVLGSVLDRAFPRDADARQRGLQRPWIQPLVFLSAENLNVRLTSAGGMNVVTRRTFRDAITRGQFPGSTDRLRDRFVNRPLAVTTQRVLKDKGLRASVKTLKVQDLLLRELLEDGAHYQDHLGIHQSMPNLQRRVRSFVVPANTTAERREQLLRAARREAQILTTLSDHENVLRLVDYAAEGPLGGPCVIFEHVADALPLDVFIRANPDLPFEDRLAIIQQLAEALEFCHRKRVVHRGLSPRAVLVRKAQSGNGAVEARLYNFQVAATEATPGTAHISSLSPEQAAVYVAPEVLEDPASADEVSDVFSLGAVAYHVLTGQPPGTTLTERRALLATGRLSVAAARDGLAGGQTTRVLPADGAFEATPDDDGQRVRSLDDVVGFATEVNRHERADSPIEWLNLLLDAATTPAAARPDAPFASPLTAAPGQRLADDLEVIALLGSGSTARVLRVRRGASEFALKVAHAPEMEDRLRQEAKVLRALSGKEGGGRIVSLEDELTLGGRACLLLTDAGESLATLIAREGPPSLDFARRWGEDLLRALEALEDAAIQHRDIKPANLGVLPSSSKKKRNLLLFDFSLAGAGEGAITAGTPAYRDPFLDRRGRWDAAADRWSAAMTLHEVVTGIRPGWGAGDETAAASEGEIRIAAERFDASGNVRPRLTAFFKKALARDVAARFDSAEAMRIQWVGCFASAADVEPVAEPTGPPAIPDLTGVNLDTPIAALPLSTRAKNALDRAGMIVTRELLQMPRNRLATARGMGRRTHDEIQRFLAAAREALAQRLPPAFDAAADAPFFSELGELAAPGVVGGVPGLPLDATAILEDAGLGPLAVVATAPRAQVERLLQPFAGAAQALRDHLASLAQAQPDAAAQPPANVDAWLDELLTRTGKRHKFQQTAGQLLGVDDVPGGQPQETLDARTLAGRLGVTQAAVHIAFGKARDAWRQHPYVGELRSQLARTLDDLGGIAPLSQLASELASTFARRDGSASASMLAPTSAAVQALARIAAEVSDDLVLGRIHQRLWLARGQAELALTRALGDRADELAARNPLPSNDEVRTALEAIVKDTALAGLAHERLVALAAAASDGAAPSARLELYPRGMDARRALELSASAIPPHQATPDTVRQTVRARYPDAQALPDGAELHALVQSLGLQWDQARGVYIRPGAEALPSLTRGPVRLQTTNTSHRPPKHQTQEENEFEARLRLAVDKRSFRVLDVAAGLDGRAAAEIERRFGARVVSLETAMLVEVDRLAAELEIDPAVIEETDRRGPAAAADWENLRRLMRQAAERAVKAALASQTPMRPILLTQVGLLARFGLDDVLADLVAHGQRDDAPPIFIINPTDDSAEWARIDAATQPLTVPIPSPAQRLKVPPGWAENVHRGAA